MSEALLNGVLAFAPTPQPGQPPPPVWVTLAPIALIMVVFYFLLIRPQQKKAKEQESLLKGLKRGDKVVTSSGIIGVVVGLRDKSVSLRSEDAKLEVLKSAVTDILERSSSNSEA